MDRNQAKQYLSNLTNLELVEFLEDELSKRTCDDKAPDIQARWCLVEVSRLLSDDEKSWEDYELDIISVHDSEKYPEGWHADSPICQQGKCTECGFKVVSWAKNMTCPVCSESVYGT